MSSSQVPASVGVIGLGAIGAGVAGALARSPFALTVCDVRPEAAAPFADSAVVAPDPSAIGAASDVVIVAVVDDAQVRSVCEGPDGAMATMATGSVIVILSTVSIPTVLSLAEAAAHKGVGVVDCGVTGGPSAASDGALVSMVGGDDDTVERVTPVLEAFSSMVVRMGPLGAGLQAKLARNVVQYGAWAAAFEGQRIAEAAGVDLAKLAKVISSSEQRTGGTTALMFRPTTAPFTDTDDAPLVGAMRNGASLARKDLAAALELAAELGIEVPLAELVARMCDDIFGLGGSYP
ncbi:MAG: NAD(P)-dependent oxidoreductase [Acidimicrobiales bacterium]